MTLRRDLSVTLVAAIAITTLFDFSQGLRYTVGDSVWSIPPYPDFYNTWSSSILFYLGDSIVFDFESEFFNVLQVPTLDYEGCTSRNAVKILTHSPAIVVLNEVGVFYYICNISNYCDLGQKISVVVHPPKTSPSPSPLPRSNALAPGSVPFLAPQPSRSQSEGPGRSTGAPSPSPTQNGRKSGVDSTSMVFSWACAVFCWIIFVAFCF